MTNTIQFNTRSLYTAEGKVITATLHDDGVVTFMDHARHIDGEYTLAEFETFREANVMKHYDGGTYASSMRSYADGMMRGGCNLRKDA